MLNLLLYSCVALSEDGRAVAYGTENGSVRLFRCIIKSTSLLYLLIIKIEQNFNASGLKVQFDTNDNVISTFVRPWNGSVKTMGFHKSGVTCVLLFGEEEMFMQPVGLSIFQSYVVISAGKDAEVKIWWDGGSAITCLQSHLSCVKELTILDGQVNKTTLLKRKLKELNPQLINILP